MRFHLLVLSLVGVTLGLSAAQVRTHITTGGTLPTNCTVGDVWYKTGASAGFYACSATDTWTAVGSGGTALSGITAATGSNTIASGDNEQIWNWQVTTSGKTAFTFGENTASTAGGVPAIVGINTLASSTAVPLYIKNYGATDAFRIDDVSGDTTPFKVDASGQVVINSGSAGTSPLTVVASNNIADFTGSTTTMEIYQGNRLGLLGVADFGFFTGNSTDSMVLRQNAGGVKIIRGSPPATLSGANAYLQVGGSEDATNGYYSIAMGYTGYPAQFAFQEINNAGNTTGDFVWVLNTTERMRLKNDGALILPSTTPTPSVSNTSANSCGTTAATIAGNNAVGTVTVGATGGTDCTLTFTVTAPVEWICQANNQTTTANLVSSIPASTTTARLVGTFGAADKLNYLCIAR